MTCSRWVCVPDRSDRRSPDHWTPFHNLSCGYAGCWFGEPVCCPLSIWIGGDHKQTCWFIPCFPVIAGCAHSELQDDGTMMVANHCGICAWPGKGCYRNVSQVLPKDTPTVKKPDQANMNAPAQVLESIPQPKSLEEWVKLAEEYVASAKCAAAAVEETCKLWACTSANATSEATFPQNGLEAWFRAEDYDPISKAWSDRRHCGHVCNFGGAELTILDEAGNGAKGIIRAVCGEPSTMLDFGNIVKPAFTCATVSRYMPGAHARIFQGSRSNWLHGHWGNHVGVAHYDGWKTKNDVNTGCQNWTIFIGQNGGESIKRCNEADVKTADGGSGDQRLMVNQGACGGEKSHFAVLEVLTWDRHLSRAEIVQVEQYLRHRLDTGFSQEKLTILKELGNCAAAVRLSNHAARSIETCLPSYGSRPNTPAAETVAQALKTVSEARECFESCRSAAVEALKARGEHVELCVASSLTQAYTRQLHERLALGKLEEAARLESIPLKVLVEAQVEAETVRRLVIPDELPRELDMLQQLKGDAQCVPCPLCDGAGSLQTDTITKDSSKKSLSSPGLTGALVAVAAARFKSLVDCETLWLFETNAGGWDAYRPHMAKVMEKAIHEGPGALVQVKGPRFEYLVDLGAMTQTNPETGTVRRVIRAVPDEDGCLEFPALAAKVTAKRRSCRYGNECIRKNPRHREQFAHPGDDDYQECVDNEGNNISEDNNVEAKPRVAAWLFCDPAVSDDWTMFDDVIAAHLENLRVSKSLASVEVIIRDPGRNGTKGEGDLRVTLGNMKAVAVATGKSYAIKRVFDDEDEEEVFDNSVLEDSPQEMQEEVALEEKKPPCWLCCGSGQVSHFLSPEDVSAATGLRESGDREAYTCLVCYGDGQYAISAQCGKHFFCADCIQGSLDAILSSGQFPAVCPMCRAEAMGDVESMQGEINDQDLSFLQHREVITKEFLFRFMRQARQSTAKYFACPAKNCGRFCLEKDPSYLCEPGSMFNLGFWQGERYFGVERQVPRLGACVCGAYICVLCNQVEENAAVHACPDEKSRPEAADGMEALLKANIAKRCPNCPALIIKNEGCNFMTCAACKDPRGFCWETGKPRYGPCPPGCGGGHNCH